MKRILITGAGSFIGTSFEKYMKQNGSQYKIDTIDMKTKDWKKLNFGYYDTIIHLAAIVHVNEQNECVYYKVNHELAVETAMKAKFEGVEQFIYFSSMSVYGMNSGRITSDTIENPQTPYAKSKLKAEKDLIKLKEENFVVSIIRPPMVYGEGAKGNYEKLKKMAVILPVFPSIDNERSMISVNNLSNFLKIVIDKRLNGILFPQNDEYVSTKIMYKHLREKEGKRTFFIPIFNPLLKILVSEFPIFEKVFGDLTYSYDLTKKELISSFIVENIEESFRGENK